VVPAASGGGTEKVEVPDEHVDRQCLTDELVRELAAIALRVEKHYGGPQDIEWALARDPAGTHRFMLLQSRPETVHRTSREALRQKATRAPSASYLSVVQNLSAGRGGAR